MYFKNIVYICTQ